MKINIQQTHHLWKNILIAFVIIGISALSVVAYKYPKLLMGNLTLGTNVSQVSSGSNVGAILGQVGGSFSGGVKNSSTTNFYISTDYNAGLGASGYLNVYSGDTISNLDKLNISLYLSPSNKITMGTALDLTSTVLSGETPTVTQNPEKTGEKAIQVSFSLNKKKIIKDDILFKIPVTVSPITTSGAVDIKFSLGANDYCSGYYGQYGYTTNCYSATTTDGKITIDYCLTSGYCNWNGTCSSNTCTCDTGYKNSNCNACDESKGYFGYPNCQICNGRGTYDSASGKCNCTTAGFTGTKCDTCITGYTGTLCNTCDTGYYKDSSGKCSVDPCSSILNPCQNGGTCSNTTGVAVCTCATGYAGAKCGICDKSSGYEKDTTSTTSLVCKKLTSSGPIGKTGPVVTPLTSYTSTALSTTNNISGGVKTATTDLYIPTDYVATYPSSTSAATGYIDVKAGKALSGLKGLYLTFSASNSEIDDMKVETKDTILTKESGLATYTKTATTTTGELIVDFNTLGTTYDVKANDVLFKIKINIPKGLTDATKIDVVAGTTASYIIDSQVKSGSVSRTPGFTAGQILIKAATSKLTCVEGSWDSTKGVCVCNTGYGGTLCDACDTGYVESSTSTKTAIDCEKSALGNLVAIILTLSDDAVKKLDATDLNAAYRSVYLMLNSSVAAGGTVKIVKTGGGMSTSVVTIPSPALTAKTEKDKIDSIINGYKSPKTIGLADLLETAAVDVTTYSGVPGLLKLTAKNGTLYGSQASGGSVTIVPAMESTIKLPLNSSYKLRIIGKNNDGSIQELNFTNVKWLYQPTNRLSSTALNSGLLEKGDTAGTTTLYTQVAMSDGSKLDSNQINVDVSSKPVIDYIHIIGSNPIEEGSQVKLNVKVSSAETISDIDQINSSIVRSAYTTYPTIKTDTKAVWFTAVTEVNNVKTTSSSTSSTSSSSSSGSSSSSSSTSSSSSSSSSTSSGGSSSSSSSSSSYPYYKIYEIPVQIPYDTNITDGNYKLVLTIVDKTGSVTSEVLPIYIGTVTSGDVNGDGNVSMLDLIIAFQIAGGSITPTAAQMQAADMDGDGKVSMIDIAVLFNKINK